MKETRHPRNLRFNPWAISQGRGSLGFSLPSSEHRVKEHQAAHTCHSSFLDACQLARKAFYPVYFYKLAFLALRPDKMFKIYIPSFILSNEEKTGYGQQSPGLQSF
ncbi:unnamed protein product [Rangifer tarandus platyrhynchus]|uniref:Uncharacterized protein n=2 Tax=Rangifer tarandus platyrhynchus TaxID=3082113 RepID=A0AC59YE96_RANTA|nr:unnamed protein product [Rangifer tarandus platyrhynchus]